MKPYFVKTGVVEHARGSCFLEQSNDKVLVSVYGPKPLKKEEAMCDALDISVRLPKVANITRPLSSVDKEHRYKQFLLHSLQPAVILPRLGLNKLEISVSIILEGGSSLAAAVTACSLALCDAGIEMYDVVAGSTCYWLDGQPHMHANKVTDCLIGEQTSPTMTVVTCAYLPALGQLANIEIDGSITDEQIDATLKTVIESSSKVHAVCRYYLKCDSESLTEKMDTMPGKMMR